MVSKKRKSLKKVSKKYHKNIKSKAKISAETVARVARIARLYLSDAETKKFCKDLSDVLLAFKDLNKAQTKNVKPSFQPLLVKNVFREDVIEKSISNEEALQNTMHREKKFFKGPRAV